MASTNPVKKYINVYRKFHGIFIPEAVCKYKGISPIQKMIYGRLIRYAGEDGDAFPRVATIAKEMGICERQAGDHLRTLEDHGFIEIVNCGPKPSYYKFLEHPCYDGDVGVSRHANVRRKPSEQMVGENPQDMPRENPPIKDCENPQDSDTPILILKESQLKRVSEESQEPPLSENSPLPSSADSDGGEAASFKPIPPPPSLEQSPLTNVSSDDLLTTYRGKVTLSTAKARTTAKEEFEKIAAKGYSFTTLNGALKAFLQDEYWGERKYPLSGFAAQVDKYIKSSESLAQEEPSDLVKWAYGLGEAKTATPASNTAPLAALPERVQQWNLIVPEAMRVKYWDSASPHAELRKAEVEARFRDEFEPLARKCVDLRRSMPDLTFEWLFRQAKGKANWMQVLVGFYDWKLPRDAKRTLPQIEGARRLIQEMQKVA